MLRTLLPCVLAWLLTGAPVMFLMSRGIGASTNVALVLSLAPLVCAVQFIMWPGLLKRLERMPSR